MKTRSQKYSETVFNQVHELMKKSDSLQAGEKDKFRKAYGSVCHDFPLMILRSGLSQAVAFVWMKAQPKDKDGKQVYTEAAKAKEQFLKNLSALTGMANKEPPDFQSHVNTVDLKEYQRLTRIILTGSLWYKRFAESLLGVTAGEQHDD